MCVKRMSVFKTVCVVLEILTQRHLKSILNESLFICQRAGEVPTNSMHHSTPVNQELSLGRPSSCLIYNFTQTNYICMI